MAISNFYTLNEDFPLVKATMLAAIPQKACHALAQQK